MSYNKFLKILKTASMILVLIAIVFGAFGYWAAMLVLLCVDLLAMIVLYRCPVCHTALDTRTPIDTLNYCPNCSEDLNAYELKLRRNK